MQNTQQTINIRVTDRGEFTYEPSVKHLSVGQSITWISHQGPFSISFHERTPFSRVTFHSERSEREHEWVVSTREIEKLTQPGHFHYSVAIYAEGKVFLDAGCPEIIVNISD